MNTNDEITSALNVLDDFILKQRMGLYIYLRKKLPIIKTDEVRDYIDALTSVEEALLKQVDGMRRAKHTADMYSPKGAAKDMKREKERQMRLRRIMDNIF